MLDDTCMAPNNFFLEAYFCLLINNYIYLSNRPIYLWICPDKYFRRIIVESIINLRNL